MHWVSGRRMGSLISFGVLGFSSGNSMVTTAVEPPSQAEGSGLFTVALYNLRSGCNRGLESALQALKLMGVDRGVL
jgi:hypothetical protein